MLRHIRILLPVLTTIAYLTGSVHARCPQGDLNRDCQVDLLDVQVFAEQWLAPPGSSADLNADDEVNMDDLVLLAEQWHRAGIPLAI
ncbi:MAG: dockerin type I domain-containing protein, partial [Phycisphaerales bacterium]